MTCSTPATLVGGNLISDSQSSTISPLAQPCRPAPSANPTDPLERLIQLVHANDRLMDELAVSRARIVAARIYIDRAGCNVQFGSAHLDRCRVKHSGILAQLRANRIEALHLLTPKGLSPQS